MVNDDINISPTDRSEDSPEHIEMMMFPNEILKNILMYVDDHSMGSVALVCRTFYEIVCELERDKIPLELSYSEVKRHFVHLEIISLTIIWS